MAISKVRVKINGTWTNLTLNSSTGEYEATIESPAITSYNLPGGYYPIVVEAISDSDIATTKDDTDALIGDSLRLTVKETVEPVIELINPKNGSHIQSDNPMIVFTVIDGADGSGVIESSIAFELDGENAEVEKESILYGYKCTYALAESLSDGKHIISINASDNDGNIAQKNASFVVDLTSPTLEVLEPAFTITNKPLCQISGVTKDDLSNPVAVEVFLNGSSTGEAELDASSGEFSKTITLVEGNNTIKVVSTDKSGRSTTVEKTVLLDTIAPQVTNVSFKHNLTTDLRVIIDIGVA